MAYTMNDFRRARAERLGRRPVSLRRLTAPLPRPPSVQRVGRIDRIKLDLATYTLAEIIECVEERVLSMRQRNVAVPRLTRIALGMLYDAAGVDDDIRLVFEDERSL